MNSKVFFHPVLAVNTSDYVDGSTFRFRCKLDRERSANSPTLKFNLDANIQNMKIKQLLKTGEALIIVSIYCSDTMYRETRYIPEGNSKLEVSSMLLIGNVEISSMIVAKSRINYFVPSGVNPEFEEIDGFKLEIGSPLSIGETVNFWIGLEKQKRENLIRVVLSDLVDRNSYTISLSYNMITINMGLNVFRTWNRFRMDPELRPYLFLSVYKDVLVKAMYEIYIHQAFIDAPWAPRIDSLLKGADIELEKESSFSEVNDAALRILGRKSYEILFHQDEDE